MNTELQPGKRTREQQGASEGNPEPLAELAARWERDRIRYCVLHDWQQLPRQPTTDLDLVVHRDDWGKFLRALETITDVVPVQSFQHQSTCFYTVLAVSAGGPSKFFALDVAFDYRRDGNIFIAGTELLAGRRKWRGFFVASEQAEFRYLLTKRLQNEM